MQFSAVISKLQYFALISFLLLSVSVRFSRSQSQIKVHDCSISETEYMGLWSIWNATSVTEWAWDPTQKNSTHWHFPASLSTPCADSWQGVGCNFTNIEQKLCGVIGLSLNFNLYGSLSEEIGSLSNLQSLFVTNNPYLWGEIPESLFNLTSLTELSLTNNSFYGSLAESIDQFSLLESINLEYNSFGGTLPTSLFSLQHLEFLILSYNSFSGSLSSDFGKLINVSVVEMIDNRFTGTIPAELGDIRNLTQLNLYGNSFDGALPPFLPVIRELNLGLNYFSGALPEQYCYWTALTSLELSFNQLKGSLPTCIGQLSDLVDLLVNDNYFTSTLPAEMDSMRAMSIFDVSGNILTGSFPLDVLAWTKLTQLLLSGNNFDGTIPHEIGDLTGLLSLDLSENSWTGQLPSEMGYLTAMRLINIYDTLLSGSVPSTFDSFRFLTGLFMYDNFFSRAIPSELARNEALAYLNLETNYFSQTLPVEVVQMDSLQNFQVSQNLLIGPNPLLVGVGSKLTNLVASNNALTGSLPTNFSAFQSIEYLYLDNNALVGPLPMYGGCEHEDSSGCSSLIQLSLFSNSLTGTIPLSVCSHSALTVIALSDNSFHGSLPSNLYKLAQLEILNISGNLFSGRIDDIFPANYSGAKFPNLTYIDFSNNSFTGTIPSAIFLSESLEVASLSSNCFWGTLPLSLCDSKHLESVVMNSLSSGVNCNRKFPIMSRYMQGIFPGRIMSGSIPTCLWSISTLATLHLSGNGLSGYIPDVPLFDILSNVELGGNALTGTIPNNVQTHGRFTSLGLQQNKLTGVLSKDFVLNFNASNTTNVNLKVNRLSGTVPTSFLALSSVNILTGNMFSCVDTQSLPANDPSIKYYSCGSVALNTALITWTILVFGVVVLWASFLLAVNHISKSTTPEAYQQSKSISALIDIRRNRKRHGSATDKSHGDSSNRAVNDSVVSLDRGSTTSSIPSVPSMLHVGIHNEILGLNGTPRESDFESGRFEHRIPSGSMSSAGIGASSTTKPKPWGRRVFRMKDVVARIFIKTAEWHTVKLDVIRDKISNTFQFLDVLRGVSNGMIVLGLIYVFICMVYYICIKNSRVSASFSTQVFQYGWLISSAFLHDYVPATVILVFLFCSMYLMCSSVRRRVRRSGDEIDIDKNMEHDSLSSDEVQMGSMDSMRFASNGSFDDKLKRGSQQLSPSMPTWCSSAWWKYMYLRFKTWLTRFYKFLFLPLVFQGANLVVTVAVNAEYVQASESISPNYLILIQSSLSAFKIGWACLYVPWAMSNLRHFSTRSQLRHQVTMYIIVVVVSPVLAAISTDQRCFYEAIFGSPSVTTSYSVPSVTQQCTETLVYDQGFGGGFTQAQIDCTPVFETTTVYSTATPPFIYSYQCGSAILVDFVPVLVYTYVFSSIILPFLRFSVLHTPFHALHRYMPHWIYQLFVANSLLDCDDEFITYRPVVTIRSRSGEIAKVDNPIINESQSKGADLESAGAGTGASGSSGPHPSALVPLFDGSIIIAKRLLDFAIMLTFGLACPPLGLAVAFSVIINASIWILMVGKFLSSIGSDNKLAIDKLEVSTKELLKGATSGMWIVVFAVCMFWSIMLFDMVADVAGNISGLIYALVCLGLFPLLLFILVRIGDRYDTDVGETLTTMVSNAITSRLSLLAIFAIRRRDSIVERTPNNSSVMPISGSNAGSINISSRGGGSIVQSVVKQPSNLCNSDFGEASNTEVDVCVEENGRTSIQMQNSFTFRGSVTD